MKNKVLSYASLTLLALSTIMPAFAGEPAQAANKTCATNKAACKSSCKSVKKHVKVKTVKEAK